LLIENCPYKCIDNVSISYILPQPFNSEIEDNYLFEKVCSYLVGLTKCPSTLNYVGLNPHGQQWLTTQNVN